MQEEAMILNLNNNRTRDKLLLWKTCCEILIFFLQIAHLRQKIEVILMFLL